MVRFQILNNGGECEDREANEQDHEGEDERILPLFQ